MSVATRPASGSSGRTPEHLEHLATLCGIAVMDQVQPVGDNCRPILRRVAQSRYRVKALSAAVQPRLWAVVTRQPAVTVAVELQADGAHVGTRR